MKLCMRIIIVVLLLALIVWIWMKPSESAVVRINDIVHSCYCVECGERASYILEGNSLCEDCFRQRNEALVRNIAEISIEDLDTAHEEDPIGGSIGVIF